MPTNVSSVYPGSTTYTHEMALRLPNGQKWGLRLKNGLASVQAQAPQANQPIDLVGQYSYHLGRGYESFTDKRGHFGWHDSQNLWTLTPGKAYPVPFFYWARGLHNQDMAWGSDVLWKKISTQGDPYLAVAFTSSGVSAGKAQFWVRRRGNPGTLTVALYSDSSGDPSSSLASATLTTSDVADVLAIVSELSITQTLSASTVYHLVFSSSDTTNLHCWEIGCNSSAAGKRSTNGSSWTNTAYSPHFRVRTANSTTRFVPFWYDGAMYLVTNGGNLYINGGRGKATSGTATTLTDTALSMTTDRYINAYIHIIRGTGEGQTRQITDNDATSFTVATWSTNPSTDSEYVVYKTPWFHQVGASGIDGFTSAAVGADGLTSVVRRPAVVNRIVYFPQGDSVNIRRMQWNASTKVHDFADDSTNKAVLVCAGYDAADGPQVWRANNAAGTGSGGADTVSRANGTTWGTDLAFRLPNASGTKGIYVGDTTGYIRGIVSKDATLYVHKDNELYTVANDRAVALSYGANKMPSIYNGIAMAFRGTDLYFSFWTNMMALTNGAVQDTRLWLTDIPEGRVGFASDITNGFGQMLVTYQGLGSNTSALLMYDEATRSFHELLRGYKSDTPMSKVEWQPNEDTNPYVWTAIGDDMLYQAFPRSPRPLNDTAMEYMPESVLITSTIDLNVNPKFFGKLNAITKNLGTNVQVYVDYQTDEFVGSTTWFEAGVLSQSPQDSVEVEAGRKRKARLRFRLNTSDASTPPILEQFALEFFEREPSARYITVEADVAPNARVLHGGSLDHTPKELFDALDEMAKNTQAITLECITDLFHGKTVTMYAQPYPQVASVDDRRKQWEGTIRIYMKEML